MEISLKRQIFIFWNQKLWVENPGLLNLHKRLSVQYLVAANYGPIFTICFSIFPFSRIFCSIWSKTLTDRSSQTNQTHSTLCMRDKWVWPCEEIAKYQKCCIPRDKVATISILALSLLWVFIMKHSLWGPKKSGPSIQCYFRSKIAKL